MIVVEIVIVVEVVIVVEIVIVVEVVIVVERVIVVENLIVVEILMVVKNLWNRAGGFKKGRVDLHAGKVAKVIIGSVGKNLRGENCHVICGR